MRFTNKQKQNKKTKTKACSLIIAAVHESDDSVDTSNHNHGKDPMHLHVHLGLPYMALGPLGKFDAYFTVAGLLLLVIFHLAIYMPADTHGWWAVTHRFLFGVTILNASYWLGYFTTGADIEVWLHHTTSDVHGDVDTPLSVRLLLAGGVFGIMSSLMLMLLNSIAAFKHGTSGEYTIINA